MPEYSFDDILNLLNRYRQRVTYGAVAAVLDRPALYVMGSRPRNHWHSWVVGKESGLPTKYEPDQMHPELLARENVISTSAELEGWLRDPR
jgi:hypothetical protein